jgi:hypothetical protein
LAIVSTKKSATWRTVTFPSTALSGDTCATATLLLIQGDNFRTATLFFDPSTNSGINQLPVFRTGKAIKKAFVLPKAFYDEQFFIWN